jgi:hypothetical protein
MPTIQKELPVPANGVLDNILTGSAFEFLRQNSVISMGVVGQATGLFATITSGSDVVLEESPLLVKGTMPTIPDDMYYNDFGAPGDRLVIKVRNSTGAIINVRAVVNVQAI